MRRGFSVSKAIASILLATLLLVTLQNCVAWRDDLSSVENKASKIEENLEQLHREMEQRFALLENRDGRYDYNNVLLANRRVLDRVIDSIVRIHTETLFEASHASEPVPRDSRGVGIVFGSYVLTLNHVVTQKSLEADTPFGRITLPSTKLEEKTYLVSSESRLILKAVLKDPQLDIALFEIPANNLNLGSLDCPVGNSDELTVGTFLYIIGNPLNSGVNTREGIVSAVLGLQGTEISTRRSDLFVISNGVLPGDSGAPVLALRDGVPELVGLVQGTVGSTRIGWAIKINSIREALSQFLGEDLCVGQHAVAYQNRDDPS